MTILMKCLPPTTFLCLSFLMHQRNSRVNNEFIKIMKIASSLSSSTVCLDNLGRAILTLHLSGHFKRAILVGLRKESMNQKDKPHLFHKRHHLAYIVMLVSLIRNQQTKLPPFKQIDAEKDCWNMPLHVSDKLFDRISEASLNISLT